MDKNGSNLPCLKIIAVDADSIAVSFDKMKWISEQSKGCIIFEDSLVWGKFVSIVTDEKTARFIPDRKEITAALHIDSKYDYLDGYWGERADLVFDRNLKWVRNEFKSEDAIEFIIDGKRIRGVSGQQPIAGAEEVHCIEGGWDHEHCAICWETIGDYEVQKKTGYKNQNNEWICTHCYCSYVIPKKIDFVE
jgi:hypothetical protein